MYYHNSRPDIEIRAASTISPQDRVDHLRGVHPHFVCEYTAGDTLDVAGTPTTLWGLMCECLLFRPSISTRMQKLSCMCGGHATTTITCFLHCCTILSAIESYSLAHRCSHLFQSENVLFCVFVVYVIEILRALLLAVIADELIQ